MSQAGRIKRILAHAAAWVALITYHIVTGLLLDEPFNKMVIQVVSYHVFIYIPIFYLVYFYVLRPFENHKNIPVLILSILAGAVVYIVISFLFCKNLYPVFKPDTRLANAKLDWSFVLDVIDYYFLYYFLYALLFWYAQRSIRSQQALRQKEAEAFRTSQQLQELEGMALRAQMNPHFIFNSLNSVQFFIVDKDMDTANRYLGRFGHLIRQTLDNSATPRISVEREKEYLNTYLELEQMRMPGVFEYRIDADEELDLSALYLPPMLLQPYVENAIKHGMMHKTGNGSIIIEMKKDNGRLLCLITDNGPGRTATQIMKKNNAATHQSKGLKITEERIALLNRNQSAGITYGITDLHDEQGNASGTCVRISFPFNFVQNQTLH